MGLFVDRFAPEGELETAVTTALRASPDEANKPTAVARHVAAAKHAATRRVAVYHGQRSQSESRLLHYCWPLE